MGNKEHVAYNYIMDYEYDSEIWVDAVGYEGLYQVSNLGRIRSLHFIKKGYKILKPQVSPSGYYLVDLCKDKKSKMQSLHRLIAKTFIPNPDNKPYIDHIDRNPLNNRINNLRWCTQKENCNNDLTKLYRDETKYYKKGLVLATEKSISKSKTPIIQVDLEGNIVNEFESIADASRTLGYSGSCICRCCKGTYNVYKNCKWFYKYDRN